MSYRLLVRIFTLALLTACFCYADAAPEAAKSWQDAFWNLPVVRFFFPLFDLTPSLPTAEPAPPVSSCSVAPLDPIEDAEAQQLEARADGSAIDVSDMVPAAARALGRFQSAVAAAGGAIVLKSAYRPAAYQQHLQNVWYKWILELRGNQEPGCQDLRTQVQEEFARHHLIETQHPVAVSDHTRGLAFDATVELPRRARLRRRRVTLDSLARLAGLTRPAIAADPVHFKFVGPASAPLVRLARTRTARRRRRPASAFSA